MAKRSWQRQIAHRMVHLIRVSRCCCFWKFRGKCWCWHRKTEEKGRTETKDHTKAEKHRETVRVKGRGQSGEEAEMLMMLRITLEFLIRFERREREEGNETHIQKQASERG